MDQRTVEIRLSPCSLSECKTIGRDNQENNQNRQNVNRPMDRNQRTGSTAPSNGPFKAYDAAELFRQKKEQRMKKVQAEEERLRRRIAKPMPNFNAIHARTVTTARDPLEGCVIPETPQVLRRGLAMKQKQKEKIKEYETKLAERPPIVAHSTKVLTEEPFKPKLDPHPELKVMPFNLGMEQRLQQRKEYNENYQRQLAEKKKKEEEEKRQQEMMIREAMRKETAFKARPNPFKKA